MKVSIISLGCAKNQVDSERLASQLRGGGHLLVPPSEPSDLLVVNTCGFIASAVRENVDLLLDVERLKQEGRLGRVAVMGCLVNRHGGELRRELPWVDSWWGAGEGDALARTLGAQEEGKRDPLPEGPPWSRYLKIAEGCDHRCSYCLIPALRGPLQSASPKEILRDAERLVASGAREICLVAQDLAVYGEDRGEAGLESLLKDLSRELPRDVWVRLLYLHPSHLKESFWEHMLSLPQLLPYADVPIQHADERILEAMNRPARTEELRRLFLAARRASPDFALRTTVMVGFPGEDRRAFETLRDFLEEISFDRLGSFVFSPEEGTAAAALLPSVSRRTADRRQERIMALQERLSLARQERWVGRTLAVLVESADPDEGLAWGRSFREAPEVDGEVEIRSGSIPVTPGQVVSVRVLEAHPHDLVGEVAS